MDQFSAAAGTKVYNKSTGEELTALGEQDIAQGQKGQFFSSDYSLTKPVTEIKKAVVPNYLGKDTTGVVSDTSGVRTDVTNTSETAAKTREQYLADIQAATAITSAEEQQIKRAGEAAGAQYAPLITESEASAKQGKAKADIASGERGGFMSTQFSGIAALKQTEGKTFVGAGGVVEEQYSAYDRQIQTLKTQQAAAISQAEAAERKAITSGKREDIKMAEQMYNDAQNLALEIKQAALEQNKYALDAIKADQDYEMKVNNYNLEVQKYLSGEARADTKEKLENAKLDLDIAGLTGEYLGAPTLEAKKQIADETAKRLGIELDQKQFDELVRTNTYGTWAQQQAANLAKDKAASASNGIDIQGAAERIFNGTSKINDEVAILKSEYSGVGSQALKQMVNNHAMIMKEEAKNTGNPYYDIKASEANSGKITATQEDKVTKIFSVSNQMVQLKEAYDKLRTDKKTGAIMGKLTSKNFTDADVATLAATIQGIIPTIARGVYNEVGVLTDNDIKQYAKTVGGIDTPQAAFDKIFSNMLDNVRNNAEIVLKNGANGGANVSGFADDYKDFVNTINSLQGKSPIKMSSNPLLYNNLDDMKAQLDSKSYNSYYTSTLLPYANGGNPQGSKLSVEDAFDILKATKEQSDLMRGVNLPDSKSGGGDNTDSGITPDFNKVGGDTDIASLGKLSEKYESGGNPGAIGYDSTGGYSYGTYQLAHNNAKSFINQSKYAKDFKGLEFNSSQWQNKWKEIAKKDPEGFKEAQKSYIYQTHYVPQLNKIVNEGVDINKFSPTVLDVVWSTSVQHGANTDVIVKAYNDAKKKLGREPNDKEFITQIYNERWSEGERFASSTPQVKSSVKNRFVSERNEALKTLS